MTTKKFMRRAYGPRHRVTIDAGGESRTKQSFKDECDVNTIMARYQKTGVVTHFNEQKASYGFAPAIDYQEALNLVKKASDLFDGLPSQIRAKFQNNPREFLAFCENPDNRSEMALLGLLKETETPASTSDEEPSDSASEPLPPNPATETRPPTAE